jgi:Predicted aminopeptidases
MKYSRLLLFIILLSISTTAFSQPPDLGKYLNIASEDKLKRILSFLSEDSAGGRATGSYEMTMVTAFLLERFKSMGLTPLFGRTMVRSFYLEDYAIGRNIIGLLPSKDFSDKYIVISAHYDHMGTLNGNIYNGADDNASGVTALLTIAEMFSMISSDNQGPAYNIIFALFDGKESNMAGSSRFLEELPIPVKSISYDINIDQIGCTFTPPGDSENYILALLDDDIRHDIVRRLDYLNIAYKLGIDIDYDFYDSPTFFDIFFKISDQYNFSKRGIPVLLFTSGIHMHTYKQTDDHYFINYPILANRIKLIFLLTYNLLEKPK